MRLMQVIAIYLSAIAIGAQSSCMIDIKRKMKDETTFNLWPLVLDSDYHFKDVSSAGLINLNPDNEIILACPGSKLKDLTVSYEKFKCVTGQKFKRNNDPKEYNIYTLKCEKMPSSVNKKISDTNSLKQFVIGFEIDLNIFTTLIKVRYQTEYLYTKHSMGYEAKAVEPSQYLEQNDRKLWLQGLHPNSRLNNIYNQNEVLATMTALLGAQKANAWFTPNNGCDRGHLAARADFPYVSQQKATYYFLNALPQFHKFNSDSWSLKVEKAVRSYASKNGKIDIYTGGGDQVLELLDANNNKQQIYLSRVGETTKVPAPKLFWKIIAIDNQPQYAFVGFNNPTTIDFYPDLGVIEEFCFHCLENNPFQFKPEYDPRKGVVICCMVDTKERRDEMFDLHGITVYDFNFNAAPGA